MKTDSGIGVAFIDNEEGPGSESRIAGTHTPCGPHPLGVHDRTERHSQIDPRAPVTPIVRESVLSFEALVRRLSPTLRKITCRLNGAFSFVDDQDLFQEALIHLWTHFSSGSLHGKTDSYILQGCYFHLKNYLRKVREPATLISLGHPVDEDGTMPEDILDTRSLISYDEVEGNLQIEAMEEGGITPREKTVLLFSLEGMTTREIGKKLGISHVSVVKIRNRIREKYTSLNG
jgi:RNA polymerase sigma factor (sigma-70 family)